jgi:hypothetical protein
MLCGHGKFATSFSAITSSYFGEEFWEYWSPIIASWVTQFIWINYMCSSRECYRRNGDHNFSNSQVSIP